MYSMVVYRSLQWSLKMHAGELSHLLGKRLFGCLDERDVTEVE